jgi:hypothetical protein
MLNRAVPIVLLSLAACAGPGGGNEAVAVEQEESAVDERLRCAATISAADRLMGSGRAPVDAELKRRALLALMQHLNAYAIPRRMAEKQAFAEVERERERIIASQAPAAIVEQARACVASASA